MEEHKRENEDGMRTENELQYYEYSLGGGLGKLYEDLKLTHAFRKAIS